MQPGCKPRLQPHATRLQPQAAAPCNQAATPGCRHERPEQATLTAAVCICVLRPSLPPTTRSVFTANRSVFTPPPRYEELEKTAERQDRDAMQANGLGSGLGLGLGLGLEP